jgi:hypothetical protein
VKQPTSADIDAFSAALEEWPVAMTAAFNTHNAAKIAANTQYSDDGKERRVAMAAAIDTYNAASREANTKFEAARETYLKAGRH